MPDRGTERVVAGPPGSVLWLTRDCNLGYTAFGRYSAPLKQTIGDLIPQT